jgi:hypothetical protein
VVVFLERERMIAAVFAGDWIHLSVLYVVDEGCYCAADKKFYSF